VWTLRGLLDRAILASTKDVDFSRSDSARVGCALGPSAGLGGPRANGMSKIT